MVAATVHSIRLRKRIEIELKMSMRKAFKESQDTLYYSEQVASREPTSESRVACSVQH